MVAGISILEIIAITPPVRTKLALEIMVAKISPIVSTQPKATSTQTGWRPKGRAETAIAIALSLAAMLLIAQRAILALDLPLWIDESWTAGIITQDNWPAFWHELRQDPNGPLYYVIMRLWIGVAGVSNFSLRLPSIVATIAAAAMPLVWRAHRLPRSASLVWAVLIMLWWNGSIAAVDARTYGLLLFLVTCQTIAFMALLYEPNARQTATWSTLAACAILAHYHAAILIGVQGLLFVIVCRRAALRNAWAIACPQLPMLAWVTYHFPSLIRYSQPDVVSYSVLSPSEIWSAIKYVLGPPTTVFPALVVSGLCVAHGIGRFRKESSASRPTSQQWDAAVAGLIALIGTICISIFLPILELRYLTTLVPSVLMCLVLIAMSVKRDQFAYTILLVLFAGAAGLMSPVPWLRERAEYGFQAAMAPYWELNPDQIIVAIDFPGAKIVEPHTAESLIKFEAARHHNDAMPIWVNLTSDLDPNIVLLAKATGRRPVIFWMFTNLNTQARKQGILIPTHRDWKCRFTSSRATILTCVPRRLVTG